MASGVIKNEMQYSNITLNRYTSSVTIDEDLSWKYGRYYHIEAKVTVNTAMSGSSLYLLILPNIRISRKGLASIYKNGTSTSGLYGAMEQEVGVNYTSIRQNFTGEMPAGSTVYLCFDFIV